MLIIYAPALMVVTYYGFTVYSLIKKKRDGEVWLKMAISMFVVGALAVLGMIFGFIEYSNASRIGAADVASRSSSQITVGFFVAAYMFIGGIFLMRSKK